MNPQASVSKDHRRLHRDLWKYRCAKPPALTARLPARLLYFGCCGPVLPQWPMSPKLNISARESHGLQRAHWRAIDCLSPTVLNRRCLSRCRSLDCRSLPQSVAPPFVMALPSSVAAMIATPPLVVSLLALSPAHWDEAACDAASLCRRSCH